MDFDKILTLMTVVEKAHTLFPTKLPGILATAMRELEEAEEAAAEEEAKRKEAEAKKAAEEEAKKGAGGAKATPSAQRSDGQPTPSPMGTPAGESKLNLADTRR